MPEDPTIPQAASIPQLLRIQADRRPDAVAIAAPGRAPLSFGRLRRHLDEVVEALNEVGVGRNDRVALVLPQGPEAAVAILAVCAGATCVPINPASRPGEYERYLTDLHPKVVVVPGGTEAPDRAAAQGHGIPIVELLPVPDAEAGIFTLCGGRRSHPARSGLAEPDDVALALLTSGTTARPKIVPLTHANISAAATNNRRALELTERDRCLNVMPLFHTHGLVAGLLSSLMAGASVMCTQAFDSTQFFDWIDAFWPTWYTAVPTMHQAILARAADNREIIARRPLRFIRSASAALSPQVMAQLEAAFNAPVTESYGLTEALQITNTPLPPRGRRIGSVGVAAGAEVAIMDEAGNLLPPGNVGEIVCCGAMVMRGYENDPQANANAFAGGWFRTGDQGFLDPDGFLYMTGRLKEIINRGGEKISPREVDEVLLDHPAVVEAVTFAAPHPTLGEDVAVAVVLRGNAALTGRELRTFAATRLADFKVPRRVLILNNIPKGPTGKPERIRLAELLGLAGPAGAGADPGTPLVPPRTPLERVVARIWGEVLERGSVGIHDDFLEMGGDSLQAGRILARLHETLGVELPATVLFEAATVVAMAAAVAERLGGGAEAAKIARIVGEVDELSDAEAQRLLAGGPSETSGRQERP